MCFVLSGKRPLTFKKSIDSDINMTLNMYKDYIYRSTFLILIVEAAIEIHEGLFSEKKKMNSS